MRNFILLFVILSAGLAACSAGGAADIESAAESVENEANEADLPALELVTPISDEAYPAPPAEDGYPVSPVEAGLPTGYPEMTVVAPSGEVDLADLTPIAPDTTPQLMPAPGRPGMTPSPRQALMLEAVVRDLNVQTDVPVDEIRLVSAEPTVWPNGGLGCPAEGMAYIEVLVEGMLITLEAGGRTYSYHTDGGSNFTLCQDGVPISSGVVPQR